MSDSVWRWPALDLQGRPAPARLEVGRAVWGKVHGAASDYRWIASTPGLEPRARRLERELLLGTEDTPEQASCWRALADSYCAVFCYRSRAMDAARRSDFLEKQLLEWRPDGAAPAALAALLLLPRVARFDDNVWWESSCDPGWSSPEFLLTLSPGDAQPSGVSEDHLARLIEIGCNSLRDSVEEPVLAAFYSSLLRGQRPAFLPGLTRPLPPEAVAALLLPLPREQADGLSIAGWVVSQRINPDSFFRLWDVLVCPRVPASLRAAGELAITAEGKEAARAVLSGEPPRASRPVAASPAATPHQPEIVKRLTAFANDGKRRWLDPEELAKGARVRLMEEHGGDLAAAFQRVHEEAAGAGDPWQRKHLLAKADLLRAAALVLAPSTVSDASLPEPGRVPALLLGPRLEEEDWDSLGEKLGRDRLSDAIRQSLACSPDLFGGAIRSWLGDWQRRTRHEWLRRIVLVEPGASGAQFTGARSRDPYDLW